MKVTVCTILWFLFSQSFESCGPVSETLWCVRSWTYMLNVTFPNTSCSCCRYFWTWFVIACVRASTYFIFSLELFSVGFLKFCIFNYFFKVFNLYCVDFKILVWFSVFLNISLMLHRDWRCIGFWPLKGCRVNWKHNSNIYNLIKM